MTRYRGVCLVLAVLAAAGCSSADSDWSRAQNANTVAAYQDFVNGHANDPRVAQAREQIQKLQDEQAWSDAQKADTAAALQQYIQSEPSGAHVSQARDRVAELERAAAWKVAEADGSEGALKQFLQKYAQGPEADQARAKLAQLDHYRVELASYHSKRQAEKDRARLQARYGKVVQGLAVVASSTKLNNIESAPMGLADAQSACASLQKEHQHCEILTR
jgi:hypothetical protein